MSLEEDIAACFPAWMSGVVGEPIEALVILIREREKLFVGQVGRLKIDLHFAILAQDALQEEHSDERVALQDRIEELEKQLDECLGKLPEEIDSDDEEEQET